MCEPSKQEIETTERLYNAIITALNEQEEIAKFTIGECMNALFSAMVNSAKASPQYDPRQLVKDCDAAIREAVELQ